MGFGEAIRSPSFINRAFQILFAIIVFACILDKVKADGTCWYNGNMGACNFGVGISVIALILALVFAILEIFSGTCVSCRKIFVIGELFLSVVWTFLWFVCFCFLVDQWRKTGDGVPSSIANNAQAAIAFVCFSFVAWAYSSLVSWRKYRNPETTEYQPSGGAFGGEAGGYESYQ
eukprot:Colp12_sorted_trinity150504_noHs@24013